MRNAETAEFPDAVPILPDLSDKDGVETAEWIEALSSILKAKGAERCRFLVEKQLQYLSLRGFHVRASLNSPYCNTIPPAEQPPFPGDLGLERQISSLVRWNATAMVVRANRYSAELGGI